MNQKIDDPNFCSYCGRGLLLKKEVRPDQGFDRVTGTPLNHWAIYAVCPQYQSFDHWWQALFDWGGAANRHDHFVVQDQNGTKWPVPQEGRRIKKGG
jgi:hypothetical protein